MTPHLTFEESVNLRSAWTAHLERTACTPPASKPEPVRVPPPDSVLEGCTLRPGAFDLSELQSPVITGLITDIADGLTYPFGTCATGFFCCNPHGLLSYPDAAGLMDCLHYSLTGESA